VTDVPELARKSSVAWIRVEPNTFPVWHEWVDGTSDGADGGAICVVGSYEPDGSEQQVPALGDGDEAVVFLRAKTDRQLAAAVPVIASVIEPDSELWEPITSALKSGRLNAPDLSTMVDRWARECLVLRLVPTGEATLAGDLPDTRPRTAPRLS
jgi:hypothetical protein